MAIEFFNNYSLTNLPTVQVRRLAALDVLVERLANMRQELETMADVEGTTLLGMKANVGLMLSDFCNMLELTAEEREKVLGPVQLTIENFIHSEVI